jgi:hypothetical protein
MLRIGYLAVPIAILCLDFLFYPTFFEGYEDLIDIDIARLVTEKDLLLGTFRAHSIRVSMDKDIQERDYLTHLKTNNNALVVSVFVDDDGHVVAGGLVNTVVKTLRASYPQDAQLITDVLNEQNRIHLGQVVPFELHTSMQRRENLPVKYVMLVPLPYSDPEESKKRLPDGLAQALQQAEEKHVSNVIVPCLGTNWGNKNSIGLDDFFSAFFSTIPTSTSPQNIYLSFYNEWPTFYLEAAVSSLNANWHRNFAATYRNFPSLYQREFRLMTTFLFLCLLVSSFSVRMTPKNWLIVSATFVGLGTALEGGVINQFRQALSPAWGLVFETSTLAGLAILFRYIVTWNPKNVFK